MYNFVCFFFFFQAEDGIRDLTVTGVQTCALPIWSEEMLRRIPGSVDVLTSDVLEASHVFTTSEAMRKVPGVFVRDEEGQIGRASCRKGVDLGGRRSSKKKKDKGISYINVGN